MENKADVKAISARFNTGGSSMDSVPGGRPKVSVHPTFSSGPPTQPKKSALEMSLSGGAATSASTPKPNYLKSTASTKSAPEVQEFPKPKPLVSKFGSPQDEGKPPICKPKPPESLRDTVHKLPLQKLSLSATVTESKPAFSKLPPAVAKPPWIKEGPKSEDGGGSSRSTPPKMPLAPKPKSWSQTEQGNTEDSAVRPFPASPLKPSGIQAAQSIFNKESANTQEKGMKDRVKAFDSHDFSGPKPSVAHKPSFVKKHLEQKENNNPSAPKRSLLPNKLALGTAPAKPNRPPIVTLEKFKKGAEPMTNGPGLKKGSSPLPPASHLSNHVAPPLPSHPGVPCLPPRPSGAIIQPDPDENYDDVVLNNPPPLPSGGHPSQIDEDSGSDGEMYEDLDDRWSTMDLKEQEKKREKEEKKRMEQEKKEQKEREKKEQDVRKRFKLVGPIQVIHQVKAKLDCKGSKMDLSVKQGEPIEVIRISDNPEGRWLGRTREGSYGYVKTDSVEIDFDTLKRQGGSLRTQEEEDPEVYDDIAVQDDFSSVKGAGVILPPPPEEDGEIYDDIEDPDLNVRVPPPLQFAPEGNIDNPEAAIDDEIYDDVEVLPPLPPLSSVPQIKPKGKTEEKDPKRQKKFEKEEKEFRKKFKFDGEIQVLYRVTIISTLTSKKWGSKDLPLKPGEIVDVIVKPVENKLIGRNEEGKFGYISTSNIEEEDTDIYDDIGEDCIYDND